jgi:hypothetical protein
MRYFIWQTKRKIWVGLALLLLLQPHGGLSQEVGVDWKLYRAAVKYCREKSLLRLATAKLVSMSLSEDKQILCFDGNIEPNVHSSLVSELEEGGLFVVRSLGGRFSAAIRVANLLRDRRATVVIYDYCISACAAFFLTASDRAYVLQGSLVAWHNPRSEDAAHPLCSFLATSHDGGPKKLRRGLCRVEGDLVEYHFSPEVEFFKERAVDPSFDLPPDSLYVRKRVTSLYNETGLDQDLAWTLHPRNYPHLFRTKISYEAYPKGQDEVDAMVARLGLSIRVIYDP